MKCPHCGAENADDAKYCNLCTKTFLTPAEVEFVQEIKIKKEINENKNSGVKFPIYKIIFIMVAAFIILGAMFLIFNPALKKSVSDNITNVMGVSTSKGAIKVKRNIGGKNVEATIGKLPDDFPDFPQLNGAKVKISQKSEGQGETLYTTMWEINKKSSEVIEFYKTELPKYGFEITNQDDEGMQDLPLISFSKSNTQGKLTITEQEETSQINLSLSLSQ